MTDTLKVRLCGKAAKQIRKIQKRDAKRAVRIGWVIQRVEEFGWHGASKTELIKELRPQTNIGEIRDTGKGGYRLIFFWYDKSDARYLYVCEVESKSILKRARLNAAIKAVEGRRDMWLTTGEC